MSKTAKMVLAIICLIGMVFSGLLQDLPNTTQTISSWQVFLGIISAAGLLFVVSAFLSTPAERRQYRRRRKVSPSTKMVVKIPVFWRRLKPWRVEDQEGRYMS